MSDQDVEKLIEQLGLDDNPTDDSSEIIPQEVNTAIQVEAGDNLINKCKDIYQKGRENDLAWRWMIGQEVNDAYDNDKKYEEGILKKISSELDIAVSDLSRFRKFYLSFDKNKIIERAKIGYTWSHFKLINDLPDGDIKKRLIAQVEKEDEVPKVKDLQQTISDEKNAQLSGLDNEDTSSLGGTSGGGSTTSSPSPLKPVNAALKTIEKLADYLTDILFQEQSGIDFDTDNKQEKYNAAMDELNTMLKEIHNIYQEVWGLRSEPEPEPEESLED